MKYGYSSLYREKQEIRLLKILLPQKNADVSSDKAEEPMLSCTVFHVSLDQDTPYKALSYVWGDPKNTKSILLDDQLVSVSANLEAGLRQLQNTDSADALWVDAICINQTDLEEKSWQVQLMHSIYSQAYQVISWLGPTSHGSDVALKTMSEHGTALLQAGITTGILTAWPDLEDSILSQKIRNHSQEICKSTASDPKRLESITSLLQRAYWERVWIFQELISGKEVLLLCGQESIAWPIFELAIHLFWNAFPELRRGQAWNRKPMIMGQYKSWQLACLPQPLENLLRSTSHTLQSWQASDLRDKVYALLSMAHDVSDLGLDVDYSVSVCETYTRTALALHMRGAKILSCCQFPKTVANLPTWVPDWSTPLRHSFEGLKLQTLFRAAGDTKRVVRVIERAGTPSISLRCVELDRLQTFAPAWSSPASGGPANGVTLLASAWLHKAESALVHNNECRPLPQDAFWRTIIADHELGIASDYQRATDRSFASFQALYHYSKLDEDDRVVSDLFVRRMTNTLESYKMCRTEQGRLCLVPKHARTSDVVCVVAGENIPYVLRRVSSEYTLVGPAYIHALMDGDGLMMDGVHFKDVIIN